MQLNANAVNYVMKCMLYVRQLVGVGMLLRLGWFTPGKLPGHIRLLFGWSSTGPGFNVCGEREPPPKTASNRCDLVR